MRKSIKVQFPGASGEQLAARLEVPTRGARAYALFAHCFTCSKDLKSVGWITRSLVARGIGVLRFDFTGLGESEGDFADTNFSSNIDDLVAAADWLRENHEAPALLIGHSLGGAAVLAGAHRVPESVAVATIAAPSDPAHLKSLLTSGSSELEERGEAEIQLAGRPFKIRSQLLEDLDGQKLPDAISGLERALLIFHSPTDETVGIDHARRIYKAARHPKSFISLDGADHLLLKRESDARYVGEVLASWAGRYLTEEAAPEAEESTQGEVVVTGGSEGFETHIRGGEHRLIADEPRSVGGHDVGPDPYTLLLSSLGACKSMTMQMYARRKGWPLENTEVRLRYARIHAEDCEECETEKGSVDQIEVDLAVEGPLTDEQRERILAIAERCPVHRTLTTETRIVEKH